MDRIFAYSANGAQVQAEQDDTGIRFTYLQDVCQDHFMCDVKPVFSFHADDYIFFPACCYNGNRFAVLPKDYPPMFAENETGQDMPITITDVPRLEPDGSGAIAVTTGDLATPCVGIFSRATKQAFFMFTVQHISGINLGLTYQNGQITVTWPYRREKEAYRWPHMVKANDKGRDFSAGESFYLPLHTLCVPCHSMEEFFALWFTHRQCMELDHTRYVPQSFAAQFAVLREKYNSYNYRAVPGFYGCVDGPESGWQPGWIGGAIATYPLMKLGGETEWERGEATLRFMMTTQGAAGFLADGCDPDGNVEPYIFQKTHTKHWHLVRKSGDALYFLFKHFALYQQRGREIPQVLTDGARRLADAFVSLWERYHQFGQFVHIHTGELLVGGSTAGGIVPAGLAMAWKFFGDMRYLETAKESAEFYYHRDACSGVTCGGPEEILQCPDSESAFALLESMVCLYEQTGEPVWLKRGIHMANFCSSWVVSYNYRFPKGSEFCEKGMKTTGAVFANAQNKHAAPGICTFSGDCLYKLYQWTKDQRYLALFLDITVTIGQYMSTEERPILAWDVPKDASLLNDDSIRVPREKLRPGFICERVNMSDWESLRCVGGVFNGNTCWPEAANLLVLAECAHLPEVQECCNLSGS